MERLTGEQVEQLQKALLAAFPSRSELAQEVRFNLDENLDAITSSRGLRETIFELITWAEARGRIAGLVVAARKVNPNNSELTAYLKTLTDREPDNPLPMGIEKIQPNYLNAVPTHPSNTVSVDLIGVTPITEPSTNFTQSHNELAMLLRCRGARIAEYLRKLGRKGEHYLVEFEILHRAHVDEIERGNSTAAHEKCKDVYRLLMRIDFAVSPSGSFSGFDLYSRRPTGSSDDPLGLHNQISLTEYRLFIELHKNIFEATSAVEAESIYLSLLAAPKTHLPFTMTGDH